MSLFCDSMPLMFRVRKDGDLTLQLQTDPVTSGSDLEPVPGCVVTPTRSTVLELDQSGLQRTTTTTC